MANLKTISLSDTITYIGKGFISGTSVEELELPDSLYSAGKFLDGTIIKEIVLPPNFTKLNSGMISSSTTLENLETGEELFIAMALWPAGADVGSKIHWEMFEYTLL